MTLGKDMTLRDLAQGAYRMRGIGQGQTICLLVIPEIATLVRDCLLAAGNLNVPMVQAGRCLPPPLAHTLCTERTAAFEACACRLTVSLKLHRVIYVCTCSFVYVWVQQRKQGSGGGSRMADGKRIKV